MTECFHDLSSATLRSLAASLREGILAAGTTAHAVRQVVGATATEGVLTALQDLKEGGWTARQVATLVEAVAMAREQAASTAPILDLVLSGPEVPGIPTRDTAAVMHALVQKAQKEVILVGYAVHGGRKLFEPLADRMAQVPDMCVWFCLNIPRKLNDTSLASEIVRRFAHSFVAKHWPWDVRPRLYYDPRALSEGTVTDASLHAKCVIADRREALITSANFTEAAQERNIEIGIVTSYTPLVERLGAYFEALRSFNGLRECVLPAR